MNLSTASRTYQLMTRIFDPRSATEPFLPAAGEKKPLPLRQPRQPFPRATPESQGISSRHIRTRIMTYLSAEAVRLGSREVVIPFNRQQMADYLNVDRSALSRELGKMQEEGILTFRKNKFLLLDGDTE